MTSSPSFHETRFPTDLALGAVGGPARRTEVVTLGSGAEQRNTRWVNSRRRYNVGYAIKTLDDLNDILAFFEERRGRLFGFRFKDPLDWKSCSPKETPAATDQLIGLGDGAAKRFQMIKRYGGEEFGYQKRIVKPVEGSLTVAVDGVPVSTDDYTIDVQTGTITFNVTSVPQPGAAVTCGYEFDIPVRFDTDEISVNLRNFQAGEIPTIPLVELLL